LKLVGCVGWSALLWNYVTPIITIAISNLGIGTKYNPSVAAE
jgi:hypothetical protein